MSTLIEHSQLADLDLVEMILSGNIQAIEHYFYIKCDSLFAYIRKSLFHNAISEDELRNEFYLYLQKENWKKLRSFQGKSSLNTWTYVVAIRFFLKKRPYLSDKESSSLEEGLPDGMVEEGLTYNISKFELYDAIRNMRNEKYRYLMLCELRGVPPAEVAASLNVNIDNLYTLKMRARKQLLITLNE